MQNIHHCNDPLCLEKKLPEQKPMISGRATVEFVLTYILSARM